MAKYRIIQNHSVQLISFSNTISPLSSEIKLEAELTQIKKMQVDLNGQLSPSHKEWQIENFSKMQIYNQILLSDEIIGTNITYAPSLQSLCPCLVTINLSLPSFHFILEWQQNDKEINPASTVHNIIQCFLI